MTQSGRLSWGQSKVWTAYASGTDLTHVTLVATAMVRAPEGLPVDRWTEMVHDMVRTHEGLRTTYDMRDGEPCQHVHPYDSGRVTIHQPADEQTGRGWLKRGFDLEHEWPLRAALYGPAEAPHTLELAVHRIAADVEAFRQLRAALEAEIAGSAARPADGWSPLRIAAFERSDRGHDLGERAAERLRTIFRLAPPSLFPGTRAPRSTDERYAVRLESTDLLQAARDVAKRDTVTEPVVLTAATLLAMAEVGGHRFAYATTLENNRGRAGLRSAIAPLAGRGLVHVVADADTTYRGWLERVARESVIARRYSHMSPDVMRRAQSEVVFEHGTPLHRPPDVNITAYPDDGTQPFHGDGIARVLGTRPRPLDGLGISIRAGWWLSLDIVGGTQYLPTELAVVLAERFAENVLHLRERPDEAIGWSRPPRSGAIEPNGVATLIRELPGVVAAAVFPNEPDDIEAFLCVAEPDIELCDIRDQIVRRLADRPDVRCPRRLTIVQSPPAETASREAWAGRPVVAAGDGRRDSPRPARTAEEAALINALLKVVPGLRSEVDLSLPYCLQGGTFEGIPAVLAELRRDRRSEVTVDDLAGGLALCWVAEKLGDRNPAAA